ncbi:peptidoglycan-binding protein [Naumannella halotolerans]|uniref:Peptidoglycan hydrolase-like protein with peptidoglycan-binding domain n=1 Tax=Naumannella halotolerans TaxID=993414 RepID=A0A4R7J1N3_9ACTN|nr:peptidoglycan-binding protein [Naumannella halotolerans]TDT31061.1 peptidoglycan hydrolase-like protein with peptidoglycan-binding domain [Naumannella halotolerans]
MTTNRPKQHLRRTALAALPLLTAPAIALSPGLLPAANPIVQEASAAASITVDSSSSADNITALQHLLTANGAATDADGKYGPSTTAAVEKFQQAKGLEVDGKAGPQTMGSLTKTVAKNGADAGAVKAAQTLLGVEVDGKYGDNTTAAAKEFQSANGLASDGVVGPETWAVLFNGGSSGGGGGGTGDWKECSDSIGGGIPKSETAVAKGDFRVAECMVPVVNDMVEAAADDGVTLEANSSWRSRDEQISLRKQNCGSTEYAIYEMPSNQCSPATAKPGTSIHEYGLAIDIAGTNNSWDSEVAKWMVSNGPDYGFEDTVSSEPWHYDTKG